MAGKVVPSSNRPARLILCCYVCHWRVMYVRSQMRNPATCDKGAPIVGQHTAYDGLAVQTRTFTALSQFRTQAYGRCLAIHRPQHVRARILDTANIGCGFSYRMTGSYDELRLHVGKWPSTMSWDAAPSRAGMCTWPHGGAA